MLTEIRVRTIGSVAIEVGKRRLGPSSGRPFALLLYLASRRDHVAPRRLVQELLFPKSANGRGGHGLRQLIYRLRLIGVGLESDTDQLSLAANHVTVDWWHYVDAPEIGAPELERLSHGLFPGYTPDESESFRDWFETERADIARRLRRRLTLDLPHWRDGACWELIGAAARALLALDPLSADGTFAQAEALAVGGSPSAAYEVLERFNKEVGDAQPKLRIAAETLRRRISERLPDAGSRSPDDRAFLGREDMMRMLSALGTQVRSGLQQALLIWGEPGIGKTRLLSEYRALSALQDGYTMLLSCQAHDHFRPLGIACDLTAQLLEAPGALGCDPDARALLGRLVRANTQLAGPREAEGLDTPLTTIVRSLNDLVSAVANEGPVLVMIDDAQWLDVESSKVILGVFSRRTARPCWLVVASRERTILAGADAHSDTVSSVRLNPLDGDASRELVRRLLQPVPDTDYGTIEGQILKQAHGNPFILRLLCAHFTATGNPESIHSTVTEILDRRVQQLSPEATRTLEACVVLGKNCTFARLERLLESPRHQLLHTIEELDDRGLIEVSDGFIVSSHALLAGAVSERMAPSVNKLLHAAAAKLLQRELRRPHSASLPWDCAEHWRVSGNHSAAIKVLEACARRSMNIGRATDALKTYEHALTLALDDSTKLAILDRATEAAFRGLEFAPLREMLARRNTLRTRIGLPITTHDDDEIKSFAGILHSDADPRPSISQLLDCLTAGSSSSKHVVMAAWQLIMIADLTKDRELAEFAFRSSRGRKCDKRTDLTVELVYHTCFGSIDEGLRIASQLRNIVIRGAPRRIGAQLNIGYAFYRLGHLSEACALLEDAFQHARRIDLRNGVVHGSLFLAQLAWAAEDIGTCRKWHELLSQLLLEQKSPEVLWDYAVLNARLAMYDKNFEAAQAFIASAKRSPQAQLELPRMLLLSCGIDLRYERGETLSSTVDFEELYALHLRARTLGGNDEVLLSLLRVLSCQNRLVEAADLISDYNSLRRDRVPKRSTLAHAIDDIMSRARLSSEHSQRPTREDLPPSARSSDLA